MCFSCAGTTGCQDSLPGLLIVDLPWQVWLSSDRTSPLGHSHWYESSTSIQVWLQPPLLLWQPSISAKDRKISTPCSTGSYAGPSIFTDYQRDQHRAWRQQHGESLLPRRCRANLFLIVQFLCLPFHHEVNKEFHEKAYQIKPRAVTDLHKEAE